MCVIIIKKAGVDLPAFNILEMCFKANNDGCGFSTGDYTFKTLDFYEFYNKLLLNVTKEKTCIIHFRFATNGSVRQENCHPFVDEKSGLVFAHNGIIGCETFDDKTDSEIFFRYEAMPIIRKFGLYSKKFVTFAKSFCDFGSKFAFITREGKILYFGNYTKYDGLLFSNMRWMNFENYYYSMYSEMFNTEKGGVKRF